MAAGADRRRVEVTESRSVPWLSVVFGYGAMLPLAAGAVNVWLGAGAAAVALDLSILWGGALLTFLAGVRRGVSFRTAGGPIFAQIAAMLWLFGLGFAALAGLIVPARTVALALLLAGFASLIVLDPIAARRGETPLFFARLRPPQMTIAALALAALLVSTL